MTKATAEARRSVEAFLREQARHCTLCPRECGVDRGAGETGYCGVGLESRYISEFVHFGEEKRLIPSYVIFFSGCNIRCGFCYNYQYVVRPEEASLVDVGYIRREIGRQARRGAATFSVIGGEPACNIHTITRILKGLRTRLPVVWNSNFYFSEQTRGAILALSDVLLADFKFGNAGCAERIADAGDYVEVVTGNLGALAPERDTIVRHLLVPGHFECCTAPVIEWMAGNLPETEFSILGSYIPRTGLAGPQEFGRTISGAEHMKAVAYARAKGLRLAE